MHERSTDEVRAAWPLVADPDGHLQCGSAGIRPADVVVSKADHASVYHQLVSKAQACRLLQLKDAMFDPTHTCSSIDRARFTPGKSVDLPTLGRTNFDADSFLDSMTPCAVDFQRARLAMTDGSSPVSAWSSLGETGMGGLGQVATVHIAGPSLHSAALVVRARPSDHDVGLYLSKFSGELLLVGDDAVVAHIFGDWPDWAVVAQDSESATEKSLRLSSTYSYIDTVKKSVLLAACGGLLLAGGVSFGVANWGRQRLAFPTRLRGLTL